MLQTELNSDLDSEKTRDSIKHRLSGLGFGKTRTGVQKSGPGTDKDWTGNKCFEYENGIQIHVFEVDTNYYFLFE